MSSACNVPCAVWRTLCLFLFHLGAHSSAWPTSWFSLNWPPLALTVQALYPGKLQQFVTLQQSSTLQMKALRPSHQSLHTRLSLARLLSLRSWLQFLAPAKKSQKSSHISIAALHSLSLIASPEALRARECILSREGSMAFTDSQHSLMVLLPVYVLLESKLEEGVAKMTIHIGGRVEVGQITLCYGIFYSRVCTIYLFLSS